MRIDDENKVVWCNEEDMKWYVSFDSPCRNNLSSILKRIEVLSRDFGIFLPRPMDRNYRINLIKAITSDYEFKLEQPKKYYWRKKRKYLAWFEDEDYIYLNLECGGKLLSDKQEIGLAKTKFTEQEARNILENDFDMFECVEVD